jgi:hypothetical protein
MRRIAVVLLCMASGLARAATSMPPSWLVGLWQFSGNTVWVQVRPDGSVFQCRVAVGGTVFESEGRYVSPQSIHWQQIWGTDEVTQNFDEITLHGKWGNFSYHRASIAISPSCSVAPKQNSTGVNASAAHQ